MMMSLFWDLPLHVWLWEKERKFTAEEEEELLKISCKTKRTLWELTLTILAKKNFTIKTAPETILSCRARGRGEKTKEQDKDSCCTQRWEKSTKSLEPTYLRPSPVSRNLSRDDNDDAKSLLAHWQRPMLALGKNWIRRKNLQGVSCKQAAQQATQRPHVRCSTASFQIRRTRAPRTTKLCVRPTLLGTWYSSFFGSIDVVIHLQQVVRTSQSGTEEEEVISRSRSESDAEESHIVVSHLRHVFSPSPASLRPTQRGVDVGGLFLCFFSSFAQTERERHWTLDWPSLLIASDTESAKNCCLWSSNPRSSWLECCCHFELIALRLFKLL